MPKDPTKTKKKKESPFRIVMVRHEEDRYTFDFSILKNGDPIDDDYVVKWDFGDGNKSRELEPTYTYTEDGNYTVGCKVRKKKDRPEDDDRAMPDDDADPPDEDVTVP